MVMSVKFEIFDNDTLAQHYAFLKRNRPYNSNHDEIVAKYVMRHSYLLLLTYQNTTRKMKFIEYLISQKLDVNALSCDGWAPLHLLVYS